MSSPLVTEKYYKQILREKERQPNQPFLPGAHRVDDGSRTRIFEIILTRFEEETMVHLLVDDVKYELRLVTETRNSIISKVLYNS